MADFIRVPADSAGKRVNTQVTNDGTNDIYTQIMHLGDGDTPSQRQAVNNIGAALTTFPTGAPDFDVFGRTITSETNLMDMYKFYLKNYDGAFHKTLTGTATAATDTTLKGYKLTTGTANGDLASYQSHRFFHYRPGCSMELIWTMKAGDIGQAGVTRQAGWLCDIDGLYFEWDGTDRYVVVKNGNLGTEDRIEQANWNIDNLLGIGGATNITGKALDITKNNLWWVAFQFLGAGDVIFGTWIDGKKIPVHQVKHYNQLDRPYLSQGALPFGFRQKNTAIVGSASEMHVFCAVITNEGYDEYDRSPVAISHTKTITSDTFVPVISFRPTALNDLGNANRARVFSQLATLLSETGAAEFKAITNGTLVGDTWASTEGSTDFDVAATSISGGADLMRQVVGSGTSAYLDTRDILLLNKSGITRHYIPATSDYVTVCARLLTAGSSQVTVCLNLTEID